jgi:hypothetical protein
MPQVIFNASDGSYFGIEDEIYVIDVPIEVCKQDEIEEFLHRAVREGIPPMLSGMLK